MRGLAWFGLPPHWDSARIVAGVMAVLATAGAVLTAVPRPVRLGVLSAVIVYHFGGIFCATTWPEPTPWPTQQIGTRVYLPYLMFMYLRNAYHFYSPEPGPASLLYCLVKYEVPETDPATGQPAANPDGTPKVRYEHEWLMIPNRGEHLKDPLALSYYRRLSLTEQVAQTIPDYVTPASFEKLDVRVRRAKAAAGELSNYPRIPVAPDEVEPFIMQYRMPRPDVTRYLLPSYARHILRANSRPGREAVTVKMYRIEHRIIPVSAFVPNAEFPNGLSPYHPITHKAYFVGEFFLNAETDRGELVDPQDPMLYWLVPILPRGPAAGDAPGVLPYEDYMSKHAGHPFDWSEIR